eukprot:GHVP01016133.1.p1 GENE.GHVP01016133.1~~GHVP01016133.1.p1  ORF type:complete len:247 (+),score=67.52 GHVP01016133.1:49-789(+)
MTIYLELRVILPMTISEYKIGQPYTTAMISLEVSNGDTKVDITKNEVLTSNEKTPLEEYLQDEIIECQYTEKVIYCGDKAPGFVKVLLPAFALQIQEKAWNSYPICKTIQTNDFLGRRYKLEITTVHINDEGNEENIHKLNEKCLKKKIIEYLNYNKKNSEENEEEIEEFKENKTMCCYKLFEIKCSIPFLTHTIESRIKDSIIEFQDEFHKKLINSIDIWKEMSIDDIRSLENDIKLKLDETTLK